jgi:hypothetical protein
MTMSLRKKLAVAALGVGLAVLATPAIGYSAVNSLPAGTKVTGSLVKGTDMIFNGHINGVPITVTCTSFRSTGTVPSAGATSIDVSAPKITGCTDSIGGIDTITDNSKHGRWSLTANTTAPYTMTLTIPKEGATFSSSVLPTCVITAAPTAPDPVTGNYNSKNGQVNVPKPGGKIPTSGVGCSSATATTTATLVLRPNPGPPPF